MLFYILLASFSALVYAADDVAGIKFSGSLDFNYVWNFNQPPPVTQPTATSQAQPAGNNRLRAFDLYHDDFNLALAELVLKKTKGDVSMYLSLDAGHAVDVMSPNDEVTKNVSQAYLTYAPAAIPEFSVQAGKMYTHLGYELIHTSENWNYSRSMLFGYALPYWHTGVAAHYALLGGNLVPSLYVYNTTTGVYQNSRGKTLGAQLKATPTKDSSFYYNFLSGPETSADGVSHVRTLHELIATYQILPSLAFAADGVFGQLTRARADLGNGEWWVWTAAMKWSRNWFSLSPRFEIFWDRSGASTGTAQRVQSETLTAGFDLGEGLVTKLEFRHDRSSADSFITHGASPTPAQTTLTAGILYDF